MMNTIQMVNTNMTKYNKNNGTHTHTHTHTQLKQSNEGEKNYERVTQQAKQREMI